LAASADRNFTVGYGATLFGWSVLAGKQNFFLSRRCGDENVLQC
jgi:hypothetical protein